MNIQDFYREALLATGSHALFTFEPMSVCVLQYRLIKTEKRLTFDILFQHPATRYRGEDIGPTSGFQFEATNGYQVISRSRMDIQTERIWLFGTFDETRSGTMTFSSNEKRDAAYDQFQIALNEWAGRWGELPYAE